MRNPFRRRTPPPPPPPVPPPLNRFGVELRHQTVQVYPDTLGAASSSLLPMDTLGSPFAGRPPDTEAVAVAAVYRCVSLIVDQVSMLPFYAIDWATSERLDPQPPIITQPDPDEDRQDTIAELLVGLTLRGNAYLHVIGDRGDVVAARPIPVDEMQVMFDPATATVGQHRRRVYSWGSRQLSRAELVHLMQWRLPGQAVGLSPVGAAARIINGQRQADEYARRLFADGAIPSAILTSDAPMTETEAQNLKDQWVTAHRGRREPAVLHGGIGHEVVGLRPDEAQFLETRQFGATEVARIFGVPAAAIDAPPEAGSSVIYQNVPTLLQGLTRLGLQVYVTRVERALSRLVPDGVVVRADTSELLRTDMASRFDAYSTALGGRPWITPNEVRRAENMAEMSPAELGRADD